jgi:glycoside/pentoside/hexuronide:cation symporter, GPH family
LPSDTAAPAHARRLSLPTRIFYGFGSVAFGVKDNGFSYFLAFFFAQVMGLPAQAVGFAIMMALILDAFIDPIVGQLSDNTRSRWGRRHPWMYGAAIPVAVTYALIWNPPAGREGTQLLIFLFAAAVLIRSFISCYEIPSAALAAELTTEYDERTRILAYRYLFGWGGGLAMYGLALFVFLTATEKYPVGQLNREGYGLYGIAAGAIMLFAILVTSVGTHRQIPFLRDPPRERATLGRLARELFTTLRNRNFAFIFTAAIFLYAGIGLGFAINLYFSTYFWEFTPREIGLFALSSLMAAILAFIIAPRLAQRFEKRTVAMTLIPLGLAFAIGPVVLRLVGQFPPNGAVVATPFSFGGEAWSPHLNFLIIWVTNVFAVGLGIIGNILFSSMIADVVEDSELRTGRRQEGVFFASIAFAAKATTGLGIFASGLIIGAINFPTGVKPGTVDPQVLADLGLVFCPVQVVLYGTATLLLLGYGISRASHADTLRKLAAAADLAAEGEPVSSSAKLG